MLIDMTDDFIKRITNLIILSTFEYNISSCSSSIHYEYLRQFDGRIIYSLFDFKCSTSLLLTLIGFNHGLRSIQTVLSSQVDWMDKVVRNHFKFAIRAFDFYCVTEHTVVKIRGLEVIRLGILINSQGTKKMKSGNEIQIDYLLLIRFYFENTLFIIAIGYLTCSLLPSFLFLPC